MQIVIFPHVILEVWENPKRFPSRAQGTPMLQQVVECFLNCIIFKVNFHFSVH